MPANSNGPLNRFLVRRAQFVCDRDACRTVTESSVVCEVHGTRLASYVADRAPLFYRKLEQIVADLHTGYFLTAFRDTLAKLPTAQSFKESHFAEILAGLFAEDIHGLYRLYSKLSLLTAENANAYKMDLLFCDPATDPVTFLFAEVKSSCKYAADGLPAGHDKSCFADLFATFKKYDDADLGFDLTAARDNLAMLPPNDAEKVRNALLPYAARSIKFAGFVIIDDSTRDASETKVLATRQASKPFDVELICVEKLKETVTETYTQLQRTI